MNTAALLVHMLTGDSWGIQDALGDRFTGDAFAAAYRVAWDVGTELRAAAPDDAIGQLVAALRAEILVNTGGPHDG